MKTDTTKTEGQTEPTKPIILIADDDTLITQALSDECRNQGWETISVHAGDALMEKLAEVAPSVIFLDILLPGKSGLDLLLDIKIDFPQYLQKVIMITSLEDKAYLAEALERGAKYYVTKNSNELPYFIETAKKVIGEGK